MVEKYRISDNEGGIITVKKKKSLISITISRIVGFFIFLFFLVIARFIDINVWSSPLFHRVVLFFIDNLGILILITIIFLVAELFGALDFPLNLPAPLFNGIASLFLIAFLFLLLDLIGDPYGTGISGYLKVAEIILYPLIFIIVVIVGYAKIFVSLGAETIHTEKATPAAQSPPGTTTEKSWEEIGSEFRGAVYDLLHRIREELKK
ncbi:MAG: hypothetical protein LUQ13_04205 [Methanomicrobiales archaeon]|nr:hypothetical protein [Methanomicrobiales archaeon]